MKGKKRENLEEKAREVFCRYPSVKLAYLFGSQAQGLAGRQSDFDFAVYAAEKNPARLFDLKLELLGKLGKIFGEDKIDVVILNTARQPELKYNIIKDGRLIYEKEPFKLLVEPKILNEYFDFHAQLLRHGLTKA